MVRAHIRFDDVNQAQNFVATLNSDGSVDKWMLSTEDQKYSVNARSMMGVLYMMLEHGDDCYFSNCTNPDVQLPNWIDTYRVLG